MNSNKIKQGIFSLFILFLIFVVSPLIISCGSDGGGGGDSNVPLTHSEMLNTLGVDTDIGKRKSPSGDAVPEDYNPYLRGVTQLAKRSEIFLAGTQGQDESVAWTQNYQYHHTVLDWPDGVTDFEPDNMPGVDDWLKLPKAIASGDLDGDGIDEIFIAYLKTSNEFGYVKELAFKVIKREYDEYSTIREGVVARYTDEPNSEYPNNYWEFNNFNVVCGDVDGNSQKETLIAFNGSIYLVGDSFKDYGNMKTIPYPKIGDTLYMLLKISAGDLDNDGMDEFVVVENSIKQNVLLGTAIYHIYTSVTLEELDYGAITVTKPGVDTITLHSSNCAVGDLDADGLNEILFIGEPQNSGQYYMMILEPEWNGDNSEFEFVFKDDFEFFPGRESTFLTPICAIADFDGDGKKEFIGYQWMYENFSETGGSFTRKAINSNNSIYYPSGASALSSMYDCSLAVGDVDGDMKADIAYITDGFMELYCLGFNDSGNWVRKGTGDIIDTGQYYPYVTMGDYDSDSVVVEFLESETLFSDPHPVAVVAANPFWSELGMDGETSFGTTSGSDVEKEKSMGFSVGYSVGYESSGPFGLWSASVKMSFDSAFDWTATESVSIEEAYTYHTLNEDMVVFSAIPYDVYYYRIIQAPDPDMIDEVITINLPRKPVTLPVERTYYNANNGDAWDIDSTILTHSIGDPLSYPRSGRADILIASGGGEGIKSTGMQTVGQGAGYTSIEINDTVTTGTGTAFDFSVEIEAEGGAFGFTAGTSSGFHYGESYNIATSNGMLYGGEVSNMPAEYWDPDLAFRYGLFSYRATLGNEKFVVVQYYTEDI